MAKRYYDSKEKRNEGKNETRYGGMQKEGMENGRIYNKPYHNDETDRYETKEHDGSEKPYGRGYYEGRVDRRRQEMADAGMIYEDHEEIANLPQQVMMKKYPKTGPYLPEVLDDTFNGIDRQMDYDDDKRRQNFYPKKV